MPRNSKFITASPNETRELGRALGEETKTGAVIALAGTLGSGKTTFVQGLAIGLAVRRKIASPTFVKMVSHKIPKTTRKFYHFDLYYLRSKQELQELGFTEIIKNKQNIIIIEWPEKIKTLLPAKTKWIFFAHDHLRPKNRIITIR